MVEKGAFNDEVGEEVVGVPDEDVSQLLGNGLRESVCCKELSNRHQREGDAEGNEGVGVEGERFGGVNVGHSGWFLSRKVERNDNGLQSALLLKGSF